LFAQRSSNTSGKLERISADITVISAIFSCLIWKSQSESHLWSILAPSDLQAIIPWPITALRRIVMEDGHPDKSQSDGCALSAAIARRLRWK
jgi:hypothetical protein